MYTVHFYEDSRGHISVKEFLRELNKESRVKIARYIDLLEQHGPDLLRPYADHVRGKIKELRVRVSDGNVRVFYFFFIEKRVILLHAFKKKTQELPEREIEQAERNMEVFLKRYQNGEIHF